MFLHVRSGERPKNKFNSKYIWQIFCAGMRGAFGAHAKLLEAKFEPQQGE